MKAKMGNIDARGTRVPRTEGQCGIDGLREWMRALRALGLCALMAGLDPTAFDPLDFLSRLAALVPRPRAHLLTYHGVLAPAAD
jgi:hypothetical protein